MTRVAELVVEGLRRAGIDQLFCLPGVQNDDFFDVLLDARDIRPIVARHEQGAAYMALGASQITGRPAACCVVPGPGLLNAAGALTSAYWSNGRVLAVVGQIPSGLLGKGVGVLHELADQTAILRQLTKHAVLVDEPWKAPASIAGAVAEVGGGRPRPVSIEVCADLWWADADGPLPDVAPLAPPPLDGDAVDRIAAVLAGARRPLIVVGGGAQDASASVTALAELLAAPVTTRRAGHGVVDARNPLFAHLAIGHELWADADVVVGIGTRMEWPLMHWGVDGDLTVVQINIDPDELDRHGIGTTGLLADADQACRALVERLGALGVGGRDRTAEMLERRAAYRQRIAHLEPQLSYLAAIRDVLPDDGVLVEDVTQITFATSIAFEYRRPRTSLSTGAAGTLGAAVAQGIGAKAAAPDRAVVTLIGDGGFLFTATELAAAVQHAIAVVTVVFNDGAFGNVKRIQQERFGPDRTIASDLVNPDLVAFAESFGVAAERVGTPEALRGALARALERTGGPSLIEVTMQPVPSPWPFLLLGKARR